MKNMKKQMLLFAILTFGVQFLAADGEHLTESRMVVKNVALSGAPLSEVLFVLEELTEKPVIRDSKLQDVFIDLQVRHAMSKDKAILAIESALAINNIAIVELGDSLLKAVDAKTAPAQSPHFIEYSLLNSTPSEKICSKIFRLTHLPVGEFSKLIIPLLNADRASIIVFDDSNSILLTDSISNLQRVELILSKVDIPKHSIITSKIFRIKHGNANEMSELLNKVITGRIISDAKNKNISSAVETDAAATSFQFSKDLTIDHDERSNSIVVCGTQKDIEHVESIINQIDVLLDQVRIEVVIVNVKLTKGQTTGMESFSFDHNTHSSNEYDKDIAGSNSGNIGGGIQGHVHHGSLAGTIGVASIETQPIFNIASNLKKFSLGSIFRRARDDSNVKVLSSPTIVTTHNREALIKIVESRPIVKSDVADIGATAMKSTVEYKDIGIELKVKPLIGVNGVIQLEINQCVETIDGDVPISGNSMPITSKREAVSFVSVCDGDTVVLAGLQERKTTRKDGKVWLLGDIPIIGKLLFSPKSRKEETTELIVFIKPTIVSNPANDETFAKRMIENSMARQDIENFDETGKFLPAAPLPELTIGDPNCDINCVPKEHGRVRNASRSDSGGEKISRKLHRQLAKEELRRAAEERRLREREERRRAAEERQLREKEERQRAAEERKFNRINRELRSGKVAVAAVPNVSAAERRLREREERRRAIVNSRSRSKLPAKVAAAKPPNANGRGNRVERNRRNVERREMVREHRTMANYTSIIRARNGR
jgi:type II secretory pathway component GspD/PulD (secretin)